MSECYTPKVLHLDATPNWIEKIRKENSKQNIVFHPFKGAQSSCFTSPVEPDFDTVDEMDDCERLELEE